MELKWWQCAVVIATPNNTHARLATEAMSRGIHVLCEKPLANSFGDAQLVAVAAAKAGLTTMMPFTYRDTFRVAGRMARDFIDAVAAGRSCEPDLAAGARNQKLLDLAVSSAPNGGVMLRADD